MWKPQSNSNHPVLLWLQQIMKFGFVGLVNTGIDISLYFLLTKFLGFGLVPILAKSFSYTAGVVNSYIWNKNWTFKSSASVTRTFLPFIAINLVGLGLNTSSLFALWKVLGLPETVSLLLATIGTLSWNFLASKLILFRS